VSLRAEIFESFARTGAPPELPDSAELRALAEQHVVVLDDAGRITMAHPFAAERPDATTVHTGGRTWWGNCAWDGLGIAAALGVDDATITSGGVTVDDAEWFHVAVPARHWWDDIGHT
jgi:Alkylmercury lyase